MNDRSAMDKMIARFNIERLCTKLSEEADGARREMLVRLISEETEKLAKLENVADDREKDRQ